MLIIINKIIRMIIRITRLQVIGEAILFQWLKIPPYVVVLHRSKSTTYGGRKTEFGFVAVFRATNEVGIDARIPVGYKWKTGAVSMRCSPGFGIIKSCENSHSLIF